MNLDRLEEMLFYYLKEGLWISIKRFWILIILFVGIFAYLGNSRINKIPHRYQIAYIVRISKLKSLDYKSEIIKGAVIHGSRKSKRPGLSNSDILKLLRSKYLSHKSVMQKLYDEGPFITEISLPEDSSLLTIRGEGREKILVRREIDSVFQEIRANFKEAKVEYLSELDMRLDALKNDINRTKYLLGQVDKVIDEYGLTDTLIKQRNVLRADIVELRYKILDLENLNKSEIIKDHRVATTISSEYPVTKRKAFYYILAGLLSIPVSILTILGISILRFNNLPPLVPSFLKQEKS